MRNLKLNYERINNETLNQIEPFKDKVALQQTYKIAKINNDEFLFVPNKDFINLANINDLFLFRLKSYFNDYRSLMASVQTVQNMSASIKTMLKKDSNNQNNQFIIKYTDAKLKAEHNQNIDLFAIDGIITNTFLTFLAYFRHNINNKYILENLQDEAIFKNILQDLNTNVLNYFYEVLQKARKTMTINANNNIFKNYTLIFKDNFVPETSFDINKFVNLFINFEDNKDLIKNQFLQLTNTVFKEFTKAPQNTLQIIDSFKHLFAISIQAYFSNDILNIYCLNNLLASFKSFLVLMQEYNNLAIKVITANNSNAITFLMKKMTTFTNSMYLLSFLNKPLLDYVKYRFVKTNEENGFIFSSIDLKDLKNFNLLTANTNDISLPLAIKNNLDKAIKEALNLNRINEVVADLKNITQKLNSNKEDLALVLANINKYNFFHYFIASLYLTKIKKPFELANIQSNLNEFLDYCNLQALLYLKALNQLSLIEEMCKRNDNTITKLTTKQNKKGI